MHIILTKKIVCHALIFAFTFLMLPTVMLPAQVMASPVIIASQSVQISYDRENNQSIVYSPNDPKLVALNRHNHHRCERVRERCHHQCRHHHQNKHHCIKRCMHEHRCN